MSEMCFVWFLFSIYQRLEKLAASKSLLDFTTQLLKGVTQNQCKTVMLYVVFSVISMLSAQDALRFPLFFYFFIKFVLQKIK